MNRILIAAGDLVIAEGLQTALSSAGFQTATVVDCNQLLDFCRQHTPDLVVVDLELPGGGIWTAAQALRGEARLVGMPMVGLGSHLSPAEREHATVLGFVAVEGKPISVQSLVAAVRQALATPAREAAGAATPATNVTAMPQPNPTTPSADDPVGTLLTQTKEIRTLTAELKPGVALYGEEGPELFEYIENSGTQIFEELTRISADGIERSVIALQDKDLRHDFRNMIGSVTGFSELLLMESTVEGETRAKFTRIREICRHFCDLLDEQKAAAAA